MLFGCRPSSDANPQNTACTTKNYEPKTKDTPPAKFFLLSIGRQSAAARSAALGGVPAGGAPTAHAATGGDCKSAAARSAELELELIQTQMAQKPMLRAEVYAHAMRASQNRKKGSA